MNLVLDINKKIAEYLNVRHDLLLHFIVSAIICLVLNLFLPTIGAAIITFTIGILKEIYDSCKGTVFDKLDLIADILGILIIV